MDVKFFDSLFEGDSANGVKLGMGLTGGDFWPRVGGCQNLYRGQDGNTIDFENILAVTEIEEESITVPSFAEHQAGASYVYVLRRANCCGYEERSFGAAVKVAFDNQGNLVEPGCNDVLSLAAKQIAGPKVRLVWYHCPIGQQATCERFNIYWDDGTGQIDYEDKLGSVGYTGPRYYSFETDVGSVGWFQFCVRTVSESGEENEHLGTVKIQIRGVAPQGVEMLQAQAI